MDCILETPKFPKHPHNSPRWGEVRKSPQGDWGERVREARSDKLPVLARPLEGNSQIVS
jgi:hypothetical protein